MCTAQVTAPPPPRAEWGNRRRIRAQPKRAKTQQGAGEKGRRQEWVWGEGEGRGGDVTKWGQTGQGEHTRRCIFWRARTTEKHMQERIGWVGMVLGGWGLRLGVWVPAKSPRPPRASPCQGQRQYCNKVPQTKVPDGVMRSIHQIAGQKFTCGHIIEKDQKNSQSGR